MAAQGLRETLAAILAADASGYSRLLDGDQDATVAALDAARGVFRQQIEAHRGRLVDTAGDSVRGAVPKSGCARWPRRSCSRGAEAPLRLGACGASPRGC
jgi:class 3 adenylate cyclase